MLDVDGALVTYDITWMASLLNGYALYRTAYHPATDTIYIFAFWKAYCLSAVDATNSNRGLWLFMVNRSKNTLIGKWRILGTSNFAFENHRLNSAANNILQPEFISNIFIISQDEFVVKCYSNGNIGEWWCQTSWFKPSGQSGQEWNKTAIGRGNDPR